MVLDEVLCAVNAGMLSLADVLRTVREKAPNTELVLTGRGAPGAHCSGGLCERHRGAQASFADGAHRARRAGVMKKPSARQ